MGWSASTPIRHATLTALVSLPVRAWGERPRRRDCFRERQRVLSNQRDGMPATGGARELSDVDELLNVPDPVVDIAERVEAACRLARSAKGAVNGAAPLLRVVTAAVAAATLL